MPPLPLQLRLEDYQIEAIDAVRDIRNGASGLAFRLSRQQVISGIIDQWIALHAEAPPSPPVVVPPAPVAPDWEALDQVVAAVAATVEPSPETPPVEDAPEWRPTSQAVPPAPEATALQQRVLDAIPWASESPQGMRRTEIITMTGLSDTTVDSTLYKLRQQGKIRSVTKGYYIRSA